jgi:signal transduction histidine kinase
LIRNGRPETSTTLHRVTQNIVSNVDRVAARLAAGQ